MPLSSIGSEALSGVARVVFEIVVELVFHGTGRIILTSRGRCRSSDAATTAVGALFWLIVLVVAVWLWR